MLKRTKIVILYCQIDSTADNCRSTPIDARIEVPAWSAYETPSPVSAFPTACKIPTTDPSTRTYSQAIRGEGPPDTQNQKMPLRRKLWFSKTDSCSVVYLNLAGSNSTDAFEATAKMVKQRADAATPARTSAAPIPVHRQRPIHECRTNR